MARFIKHHGQTFIKGEKYRLKKGFSTMNTTYHDNDKVKIVDIDKHHETVTIKHPGSCYETYNISIKELKPNS